MRLPILPLIIFLSLGLAADLYIFFALRRRCWHKGWQWVQAGGAIAFLGMAIIAASMPFRSGNNSVLLSVMWMVYTYMSVYFAKFIWVIFDLVSRIPQLFHRRRLKWLSGTGLVVALLTFGTMWWGALVGRRQVEVKRVEMPMPGLPRSFDGLTVAQISDLHTGTFGSDTTFFATLVDSVNALHPDVIVFTGDIVNRRSNELRPHMATLARLHAPHGVYSVLGNHDYGHYTDWTRPGEREADVDSLVMMQRAMGWTVLLNQHAHLHSGCDSIALIGVENIGDPPFHTYGSLSSAYPNAADSLCKILLSHNPAHWVNDIADHKEVNIPLTLSGHTHAMQMEIAGWSPGALRYSTWGGLFADSDATHRLYVNIGAGTVGFPARIGATPEITLFTLRPEK